MHHRLRPARARRGRHPHRPARASAARALAAIIAALGREFLRLASRLRLSPMVAASSWDELAAARAGSREQRGRGSDAQAAATRPTASAGARGDWWKWKIEPHTIDAVLIHAQRGSGKRASLYTDYTFGVWDRPPAQLVPIAKAYSGLTDEEIRRSTPSSAPNMIEKFGPVRTVKPELVFELAFEGI